jgi:hypothetical protein
LQFAAGTQILHPEPLTGIAQQEVRAGNGDTVAGPSTLPRRGFEEYVVAFVKYALVLVDAFNLRPGKPITNIRESGKVLAGGYF